MTNTTLNKIILSATTAMFLTACGGSSGGGDTDKTKPVIKLNGSDVNLTVGDTYIEAGATATDNKDAAATITAAIKTTGTVDTSTADTYLITYNVTDAAGNKAVTVTRRVIVSSASDTAAPRITVDATQTVPFGGTYTPAVATVEDNVDTGLTATIGGDIVDVYTAGDYNVTYTATDTADNTGTATTVVTVTPQFTVGTDTITDALTGLVWDKNASDTCTSPKTVPTIAQFQTIMDYSTFEPAVVSGFNLAKDATEYKTSDGWNIKLHDGQIENNTTATKTICVDATNEVNVTKKELTRDAGTNLVTDPNTGLVWDDSKPLPQGTAAGAADVCTRNGGMRLPTLTELNSIYDRKTNTIVEGFATLNQTGNGLFVTSTKAAADAEQVWLVGFAPTRNGDYDGVVSGIKLSHPKDNLLMRCIKK